MYDVDYFIKKFEAIPEVNWVTGKYGSDGFHCAFGHCGLRLSVSCNPPEVVGLIRVMMKDVVAINDGDDLLYQQPTPKQRILAALYDIKKLQNKEWVDKTIESIAETKEEKVLAK